MTKAKAFLRQLEMLDRMNASAEHHRNVEITQDTRDKYDDQYTRDIELLRKRYGVTERLVEARPNGIATYELTCDDGSVVGILHGSLKPGGSENETL